MIRRAAIGIRAPGRAFFQIWCGLARAKTCFPFSRHEYSARFSFRAPVSHPEPPFIRPPWGRTPRPFVLFPAPEVYTVFFLRFACSSLRQTQSSSWSEDNVPGPLTGDVSKLFFEKFNHRNRIPFVILNRSRTTSIRVILPLNEVPSAPVNTFRPASAGSYRCCKWLRSRSRRARSGG